MHPLLLHSPLPYVEASTLMPFLSDYTNPHNWFSRLVKKGELIRMKNGFFVIAEKIANTRVPYEQIGNLLCGPSYISFEWALSHYGMIPEGVYVVTSATTTQARTYRTPLGTFTYAPLSHSRYAIGITQEKNSLGNYLIATPEKALADLIHMKSRHLNEKDLLVDLVEARRIDEDVLKGLDKKHLLEIADAYRSKTVRSLVNAIGLL